MCGLAGMIGRDLGPKHLGMFKDMLYVSSLRGPHSTGVASVAKDKIVLNKMTGDAALFLDYFGGAKGYLSRPRQMALLGHCRWATVGNVNKQNAHPFDTGRFIGAHNGTLKDDAYLPRKHDTRTDSELMFRDMNEKGIVPVLRDLHFWSAWAVSIWDKDNQRLHLARNMDRPLFFGINKKDPTIVWASELRFLAFAAMGAGLEFDWFKCQADHVYTFDVRTMTNDNMYTVEKLPAKVAVPQPSAFMEWEWDEGVHDFRARGVGNSQDIPKASDEGLPESNTTMEGKDRAPF